MDTKLVLIGVGVVVLASVALASGRPSSGRPSSAASCPVRMADFDPEAWTNNTFGSFALVVGCDEGAATVLAEALCRRIGSRLQSVVVQTVEERSAAIKKYHPTEADVRLATLAEQCSEFSALALLSTWDFLSELGFQEGGPTADEIAKKFESEILESYA